MCYAKVNFSYLSECPLRVDQHAYSYAYLKDRLSVNWTTPLTKQQIQEKPITTCSMLTYRVDESPHRWTGVWAVAHWLLWHQQEINDFPFTWLRIRRIYCSINYWPSSMRQRNLNDTPTYRNASATTAATIEIWHCSLSKPTEQPTNQAASQVWDSTCNILATNVWRLLGTSSVAAAPTAIILLYLLCYCIYLQLVCAFFALGLFHCTVQSTRPYALVKCHFCQRQLWHRFSENHSDIPCRSAVKAVAGFRTRWEVRIGIPMYVHVSARCTLDSTSIVVACVLRILVNLPHIFGIRQLQLSQA